MMFVTKHITKDMKVKKEQDKKDDPIAKMGEMLKEINTIINDKPKNKAEKSINLDRNMFGLKNNSGNAVKDKNGSGVNFIKNPMGDKLKSFMNGLNDDVEFTSRDDNRDFHGRNIKVSKPWLNDDKGCN